MIDFDTWWENSGQHWHAKRVSEGGEPWTDDVEERRDLFDRKYTRPAPPEGLYTELVDIRGARDDVRAATLDSLGGHRRHRLTGTRTTGHDNGLEDNYDDDKAAA